MHHFSFSQKVWVTTAAARQVITKVLKAAVLGRANKHKGKG
jgi:hypothetical protein